MQKYTKIVFGIGMSVAMAVVHADTTLLVTSTGDNGGIDPAAGAGTGTLRQAIVDANAVAADHVIQFDIAGACPAVIQLSSVLPTIKYGIEIDGFSQPGSQPNSYTTGDNATRCIELTVAVAGIDYGFFYIGQGSSDFRVQGIHFVDIGSADSQGSAVELLGGNDDLITGNEFSNNYTAVDIAGSSTVAFVGGAAPAQRNLINGGTYGVSINSGGFFGDSVGNTIVGNLFGTDGTETQDESTDYPVLIETSSNSVGNNVIVYGRYGVELSGANAVDNMIVGNRIGITDEVCVVVPVPLCLGGTAAGNVYDGVYVTGAADDNAIVFNTIWNNGRGIQLAGIPNPQRVQMVGNSISASLTLGIDTQNPYPNDNDTDPAIQALPNRGLNFPFIGTAFGGTSAGNVTGSLLSTNDTYAIQVYSSPKCDGGGYGEGATYHGTGNAVITNATASADGSVSFNIPFGAEPGGNLAGRQITLVATDSLGNTSEFSQCTAYVCDVIFRHGFDDAVGEKCPQ